MFVRSLRFYFFFIVCCAYIIYRFYGSALEQRIKISINANSSILRLMFLLKCQPMYSPNQTDKYNTPSHLEVGVFVDGPSSGDGHHSQCGKVHILVGEEEEIDAASLGHAVLGQTVVETYLRLKQRLGKKEEEEENVKKQNKQKQISTEGKSMEFTFSLSVPISFLSSLFFSFPGASAMGSEVWNKNNLPAQSAACRRRHWVRH